MLKKIVPQFADTIYHNGDIITMNSKHLYVTFVAINMGIIIKVDPPKSQMIFFNELALK
jgi:predicted amidohydrolase YtcJ